MASDLKQFRSYYEKAFAAQGKTGENLLVLVERRLDNVVYRAGFAMTRREARQLVSHAHFTVNGKKVNVPSYLVKPGDVVAISEKSMSLTKFKSVLEATALLPVVSWMDVDKTKGQATVMAMPVRDEIDFEIKENLIVELYSK